MVTGNKKFSTAGQEVKRLTREPFPAGEYELKVKAGWEVRKSDSEKSSQLAYANGYFEVIGTGGESGKNRRLYVSFFTDLTPGSDGVAMPLRGGGIVEFCKAVGQDCEFDIIQQKKHIVATREFKTVDTLSPKGIVRFLNDLDGTILKARIKVEKGLNGEMENKVDYFIEAENTGSDEADDEGEELDEDEEVEVEDEADAEEDSDEEDEDEDEDEDSEEDDLPPPPAKKSKVAQPGEKKAAGKKKAKR